MRLSALSATGGPGRAAPDPRARVLTALRLALRAHLRAVRTTYQPLPSVLSEDPTTVHQDKTMRVYQTGAGPSGRSQKSHAHPARDLTA